MTDPRLTLTAAEVAQALSLSLGQFRHRRAALEALGFPRSLPGVKARWSRTQIADWIAASGASRAETVEPGYVAQTRSYLERKYAGRAA